jgi:hypothetical protein
LVAASGQAVESPRALKLSPSRLSAISLSVDPLLSFVLRSILAVRRERGKPPSWTASQ